MKSTKITPKKFSQSILPLLLVLILPILVWVIMTKRFEIRKKAATGEAPTNNKITWMANSVYLSADNFFIQLGTNYFIGTQSNLTIKSSTDALLKTFEAQWTEFNPTINDTVEMRMSITFKSDGVYWWSDEIRTYNGQISGQWITYTPSDPNKPFFKTLNGLMFVQNGELNIPSTTIGQGIIHFTNLRINPLFQSYCYEHITDIQSQTDSRSELEGVRVSEAIKTAYDTWIAYGRPKMPGCNSCIPIAYPDNQTSELQLNPNTYYCEPTPPPSPSEYCRNKPNGTVCEELNCPPCPPGKYCIMSACTPRNGICQNQQCVFQPEPLNPTNTPAVSCPTVTIPPTTSGCTIQQQSNCTTPTDCCPKVVCPTITRNPIGTPVPEACPSPKPGCTIQPMTGCSVSSGIYPCCGTEVCAHTQQTINIQFRYASIPDARVTNGYVKIGVVTPTTELWTPKLKVTAIGTTGIYQASFTLPQELDPTKLYRFIIKGEKHIASKICRLSGQTLPCGTNEWITVPRTTSFTINYVNRPIEPGDVAPQDNIANRTDFDRVVQAAAKLSSKQTDQDKLVGDLDYNNVVDLMDIGLMRRSLETRPDEN